MGNVQKASQTYLEAAWNMFRERYPKMDKARVNMIMARRNINEIESYIHLAGLFKVGVEELRRLLQKDDIVVPDNFLAVLLHSEAPRKDAEDLIFDLKQRDYSEDEVARIAIQVLYVIHDEWVKLNSREFFDPCRKWQRSRFMPFELIGLETALKYRVVLDEINMVLGLKVHTGALRSLYWQMQKDFCRKHLLHTREDLSEYLRYSDYYSMVPDIQEVIRKSPRITIQMSCS